MINVNEEFIVQPGAYVASTDDLTLDTQWQVSQKEFLEATYSC